MTILDILFLPFELLKWIETFLAGLDHFRDWRQAAADDRIRRMLTRQA